MSELAIDFGDLIYEARKRLKLTQKEAAERAGITRWSILQYEKAARLPSDPTVRKICMALEIDPTKVITHKRRFEISHILPKNSLSFPVNLPKEQK